MRGNLLPRPRLCRRSSPPTNVGYRWTLLELTFLLDNEREVAVVDEDSFARLDDRDNVLVVQPESVLATGLGVLVVNRHRDWVATH